MAKKIAIQAIISLSISQHSRFLAIKTDDSGGKGYIINAYHEKREAARDKEIKHYDDNGIDDDWTKLNAKTTKAEKQYNDYAFFLDALIEKGLVQWVLTDWGNQEHEYSFTELGREIWNSLTIS